MTAPYSQDFLNWMHSPQYRDEVMASGQRISELYNKYNALLHPQQMGMPMQQVVPTGVPQQPASAGWTDEDLVGAGMFWGLPEEAVRAMPRQAVIDYVNQHREASRAGGINSMAQEFAPLAMFGVGAGEAITGTLQRLPVIGDWFAKGGIVHSADMKLRQLEEGIRASTPQSDQFGLSVANIAGNLAAMWYPGNAVWALAGNMGRVVPMASRLSPIGRAALQGGLSSYMLAGGTRSDPNDQSAWYEPNAENWKHRAEVIGGGAIFGAAIKAVEPAIGALAKRVTDAFVPPQLVQAVALEAPPPLEIAVPGMSMGPHPQGPRHIPSQLQILRAAAQEGDPSAIAMLEYMNKGQSMEIPMRDLPPAPPPEVLAQMPPEVQAQFRIQREGDFLPQQGLRPERVNVSAPQQGLMGEASNLPVQGLVPEMSPFAPGPGGSPAGTPFEDWTPQIGRMRGPDWSPRVGLAEGITHAESLAASMNKAATVIQSDDFARVASQTMIDDLAAAQAALSTNPGGSNVVQGIADPSKFVGALGANVRFAQRGGRLDALVSDVPLGDEAVKSYELFGMYPGQKALTSDGVGVRIQGIGLDGTAVVEPLYAGTPMTRQLGELHPLVSSPGTKEVPQLWEQFQQFATARAAETQAAMGGALGPEQLLTVRNQNLALWMENFLDQAGLEGPADRARVREYFNQRWVQGFQEITPEQTIWQQVQAAKAAEVQAVTPEMPSVALLDKNAAVKGLRVVPEHEGSWVVEDIPKVPEEPLPGAPPTDPTTIQSGGVRMTFASREAAETWVQQVNRELPDITPPSDVPLEVAAAHVTEPLQEPNLNAGRNEKVAVSLAEMAPEADGGSVGGELPPTQALVAEGNHGRIQNRWIQSFLRWRPWRRLSSALDEGLQEHTGQSWGFAADGDRLSQAVVQHHNEMHPWFDQLTDIFKPIKTRHLLDGTWTRIYEAPLDQRTALAKRAGFSDREIATFDLFESLMQQLFPEAGIEEIRQIPQYISHIARRQSQAELVGRAFEDFPLSKTTAPFFEYARTGNLNFREMDPRVLGETYIRAVFWKKNMAPVWDQLSEKWNALAQSGDDALSQAAHIMQQQLKITKYGYRAEDDFALDTVHGAMQMILGKEVTRQQARELFNFGLNTVHASMLGFRPSVIARDMLQAFLAIPRAGKELPEVYAKWMTDPAFRQQVWSEAVAEGAVSLQSPRMASPGALTGELERTYALPSEGIEPGASELGWRMRGAAKVTGAIRDMMPNWLKDTRDSPFHAMYLYGKQAELTRALVYTAGKQKAANAIAAFRAAGPEGSLDELMGASSARTYDPSWQRQFQQLIAAGADEEAARFLGRQLADATQFKYGVTESPWVAKSLTGRVAMQFGNYPMQYLQYVRESLVNGSVGDKAAFLALLGGTTVALNAASNATGWNFRLMNPFAGLLFTGGPLVGEAATALQGVRGMQQGLMNPENANTGLVNTGLGAAGQIAGQFNPLAGLWRTAQGIGQGMDSPYPGQAIARHLITGEVGPGPDINNWLLPQATQSFHNSLQPIQTPVRGNGLGLPPGQFPAQPVVDPSLMQDPRQIPPGIPTSGQTLPGGYGVSPGGIRP